MTYGDWIERPDLDNGHAYVLVVLEQIEATEQALGKVFKTLTIRISKDEAFFTTRILKGPFIAWKGEAE